MEKQKETWHHKYMSSRSATQRLADKIADFVGSWPFIGLHIVWFTVWIMLPAEAYPYGLLTMIVSLEAILLTTLVMISQNRQAKRDRHQADADYDTNVQAKIEIEQLQKHLARIEDEKLDKILSVLQSKQ